MKTVAVLGANGQLGLTLKDVVNKTPLNFTFFTKQELDITNKQKLEATFLNKNFDYCINCAAYTNVEGAEKNREVAFLINAEGTKYIAQACKLSETKLIHISTDYVFDGDKVSPYTTEDISNPINQYGKSKRQGEVYIEELLKEYYIIRTSWLYSIYRKNFFTTIINKTQEKNTLQITTEEQGTPTSCIDLSEFILHLVKENSAPFGVYNFSANGSTTWYGFAKEIIRNYNIQELNRIKPTESFKTIAKRPKYSVLDLTKTEIIYQKQSTWQESVAAMTQFYKNKKG